MKLIHAIFCSLGLHFLVRDYFVRERYYAGSRGHWRVEWKESLVRQCMKCDKVINKPFSNK